MPGEPEREIELHAKLIIVDDVFVRTGSSKSNNRSLGLETDLAIEAAGPGTRAAIANSALPLLPEHLVRTPAEVGGAIAKSGLFGALERLNPGPGRLRPCAIDPDARPRSRCRGTAVLDQAWPLDLDYPGPPLRNGLLSPKISGRRTALSSRRRGLAARALGDLGAAGEIVRVQRLVDPGEAARLEQARAP